MRKKCGWKIGAVAGLLLAAFAMGQTLRAQNAPAAQQSRSSQSGGASNVFFFERSGPGPVMGQDQMGFVGIEGGFGGKTVTGAPFSATFSTETTQVLADGNRIQHVTTENFARDSEGRTRRELTLPTMGPWASTGGKAPSGIIVNDPVAGVQYVLDPNRKIARKVARPGMAGRRGPAPGARFRVPPNGANGANGPNVTTTDLGTQTIDGISAQGTRTTRTIPAGQIGNQKPIVIVNERWYSPDLQMVVMSKRSDPRMGETVFQLTNIQQGAPDPSLFQVPSDYTVRQGGGPRPMRKPAAQPQQP